MWDAFERFFGMSPLSILLLIPAGYCLIVHLRSKGERPSREVLIGVLSVTLAILIFREWSLHEQHQSLQLVCEKLESAYVLDEDGLEAIGEGNMLPWQCDEALGYVLPEDVSSN